MFSGKKRVWVYVPRVLHLQRHPPTGSFCWNCSPTATPLDAQHLQAQVWKALPPPCYLNSTLCSESLIHWSFPQSHSTYQLHFLKKPLSKSKSYWDNTDILSSRKPWYLRVEISSIFSSISPATLSGTRKSLLLSVMRLRTGTTWPPPPPQA